MATGEPGRPVVVIGAQGQLGTDLLRMLPPDTVGLDWPEFDVSNQTQITETFQSLRPAEVINCAAATDVDGCESDPARAFAVNATGAGWVAKAAAAVGARVIYISTDYVFGGATERTAPLLERDMPHPVNVYGVTKLAGELLTRLGNAQSLVVRTCGLFGHAGARGKGGNFVETMLRLAAQDKPVRVVHDQRLTPTSTLACSRALVALLDTDATGIIHVAAADMCTWYEFTNEIFVQAGARAELRPITSAEYPLPARRPPFSALGTSRADLLGAAACPSWRVMLHEYLQGRRPC